MILAEGYPNTYNQILAGLASPETNLQVLVPIAGFIFLLQVFISLAGGFSAGFLYKRLQLSNIIPVPLFTDFINDVEENKSFLYIRTKDGELFSGKVSKAGRGSGETSVALKNANQIYTHRGYPMNEGNKIPKPDKAEQLYVDKDNISYMWEARPSEFREEDIEIPRSE